MKRALFYPTVLITVLLFTGTSSAYDERSVKPAVLDISEDDQIRLAESAAPPHISKDATILILDTDLTYKKARTGSNGFTCYSDLDKIDIPVPACMDAAAVQWWNDFVGQKPKPTNKVPGIAYMAQGALRWEKDGKIFISWDVPGTKRRREPPHWLIFWPFDHMSTKLPTYPGSFGTSIMYSGTPWSHLMIYQDPLLIGK